MSVTTPQVTPRGVRDGEPSALVGLAQRRSGSVLDYARHACGEQSAMDATAEAFARFRAAVVAAEEPGALAPDALLLSCTRNAAAALTPPPPGDDPTCRATAHLIVGRFEGTNSAPENDLLVRHLAACSGCTELAADFDRAERAFRAPHPPEPGGVVVGRVVASLEAAAPIVWREAPEAPAIEVPAEVPVKPRIEKPRVEKPPQALKPQPIAPAAATVTPAIEELAPTDTGEGIESLGRLVIAPTLIIAVSVLLAMSIAGVFGGTEPTPARGATGLPAPVPPALAPLADERTQQQAARAAREALRRIEARDRITTRQAIRERAAIQQRREARRRAAEARSTSTPSASAPAAAGSPAAKSPAPAPAGDGTSIETLTPGAGGDAGTDSPQFEPGTGTPPG